MQKYTSASTDPHKKSEIIGILVANLGTPDAAEPKAVRKYLREFLSDPRVIESPRWLWYPILHGIILRTRPKRSAANYAKIWTDAGSPLLVHSQAITDTLQRAFDTELQHKVTVALGMRYGQPSIANALRELREANATSIIVLPLYPQYSGATTGSIFDAVSKELQSWRFVPRLQFINQYAGFQDYIDALAASIQQHWQTKPRAEKILFSYHGLPKSYFKAGDPYYCYCSVTSTQLAEKLQLQKNEWEMVFQSRFGIQKWLQPYCDKTLMKLAKAGIKSVDIVCPGFAADCLETLEEIAMHNKEIFLNAGGQSYHYIPALNANADHIKALQKLVTLNSIDEALFVQQ